MRSRNNRRDQTRRALRAHAFLGMERRPTVSDPALVQLLASERADQIATFADPVPMNLTGLPSTIWHGETAPAQVLTAQPTIASADPSVGISDRQQFPALPSRVGIPGGIR